MEPNSDDVKNHADHYTIKRSTDAPLTLGAIISEVVKFFDWTASLEQAARRFLEGFEKVIGPITNFFNFLEEFEERYRLTEEEAVKVLKKYKWLVVPSMSLRLLANVAELAGKKGNQRGAMNKLFVDYFTLNEYKELTKLVEGWKGNSLFKPRMKIFRDCVAALKQANGNFNASNMVLPTLIAQIDGILTEYKRQQGISTTSQQQWKEEFRTQAAASDAYLADVANDLLLNYLFQRAIPGQPLEVPFTFNRHKILHGEYITYGRLENTLWAFLLLDFLADL